MTSHYVVSFSLAMWLQVPEEGALKYIEVVYMCWVAMEQNGDGCITGSDVDMDSPSDSGSRDQSNAWYRNPVFNRFWKHHSKSMEWCHHHMSSSHNRTSVYDQWCQSMALYHSQMAAYMKNCSDFFSLQSSFGLSQAMHASRYQGCDDGDIFVRPATPPVKKTRSRGMVNEEQLNKRNSKKAKKRRKIRKAASADNCRKRKRGQMLFSDLDDLPSDLEFVLDLSSDLECGVKTETDGVEYHMEITEDMLEFFAQSAKHKQERDAKKEEIKPEQVDDDYMDLAFVSAHRKNPTTTAPPTERPGAKRVSEMGALYGDSAPMIHAMETALQLTYNRNCDRKQPKLWPQLPLNIKFD